MQKEKTDESDQTDPSFEFLHFVQPVEIDKKKELDKLLLKSIFKQYEKGDAIVFHLGHPCLEDFLSSDLFYIKIDSLVSEEYSEPPPIEEIINFIDVQDETTFIRKMQQAKLKFKPKYSTKKSEPIIDCIEGEFEIQMEIRVLK